MEQNNSIEIEAQSPSSVNDRNPGVNNTQDGNTIDNENVMEVPTIAVGENDDSGISFRF